MKQLIISAFALLSIASAFGQSDTTVVQTHQFSDGMDDRRQWEVFAPDTGSYRQILMYQTLKCDPALIPNPTGSGCGEWDAGANFILYQHVNSDSLRYRDGIAFPDTLPFSLSPVYSQYQYNQYSIIYDNVLSESTYGIGTGSTPLSNALNDVNANNKAQYMWTAAELTAAGLTAGNIDKLEIDLSSLGGSLDHLLLKIKHSSLTSLSESSYETAGFNSAYNWNTSFTALGSNTINFTTPFNWDGISNVVIELSFSNDSPGLGHTLNGENTAANMGVHSTIDDGYLNFTGNGDYVNLPDMTVDFSNGYTVSTWVKFTSYEYFSRVFHFLSADLGDGFLVCNVGTANNLRFVSSSGGTGTSLTVNGVLNLNEWMHIAVSTDASGNSDLYLNGTIIGSITGALPNNVLLTENYIGRGTNETINLLNGSVNEVQLWTTPLSQTDIQDWMFKDIDASHPSYADLQAYYKLDDMIGLTALDFTSNAYDGTLTGLPSWKYIKGQELNRNMSATIERPNINLTQGNYISHLDSTLITDMVINSQREIISSELYRDMNEVGMLSNHIDTLYGWTAGYGYIYDENENIIDSTWYNPDTTFYNYYSIENKRIARYITPYGNYLDLGEGFTWVYDLTHLEPLLHDTLDLQAGSKHELIDLRFEFIKGTPPRDVHAIEKVMSHGSGKYEVLAVTPAVSDVVPNVSSDMYGLHYSVTGHKFSNATNCAEFCARTHYFEVDGTRIHDWVHFKECADNPLYPQGGTWIYDRTGWCPGAPVDEFDLDITQYVTAGVPTTLAYGVDADPSGTEYGDWSREMFFIGYSNPNFNLDAEVYDIISPNSWEFYGRYNPICDNPVIELRNSGATTLTTVDIEFGVVGGAPQTYTWTGSLGFMDVERVVLPMHSLGLWQGSSQFYAKVITANGVTDDYSENDQRITSFEAPPTLDSELEINMKTNAAGGETSWDIRDGFNNVLYSGAALSSNTIYNTPITLPVGCYTLNVYDSGDDGLDFWANSDGIGYFRIKNAAGMIIKVFEADFGDNIHYQFSVGESVGLEENENGLAVNVFPNPSTGLYNVQFSNETSEPVELAVFDALGALIYTESIDDQGEKITYKLDLSKRSNGIYTLRLTTVEGIAVLKLNKH